MATEHGYLQSVTKVTAGDQLTVAAAISDLTLFVGDVADFDEDGGWLKVGAATIAYTTCDDTLGSITLATAMVATAAIEDRVDVWDADNATAVVEYVAAVILDGQDEGDPIEAAIDHALVALLPPTINTEGGWSVSLSWVGDDLHVTRVIGKEPVMDGSVLDPGTIPDPVPITPPVSSPALKVWGTVDTLIAQAADTAPSTLIEYHISTTSGFTAGPTTRLETANGETATKTKVFPTKTLADESLLEFDTDYYMVSVATNAAGTAPQSAEVTARLDPSKATEAAYALIVAGIVMAGRLEVGPGYWEPGEGIVLPQPNGTTTRLTTDGVTASTISGFLIALGATIQDNLNLYGLTQLFGTQRLTNGISNPAVKAGMSRNWHGITIASLGATTQDRIHGLCDDNAGTNWLTPYAFGGLNILGINKTTGAWLNNAVTGTNLTLFSPVGGIARIGTTYYVLGQDLNRAGAWYVYVINSSYAKTGEWLWASSAGTTQPAISTDAAGTGLAIAWCATASVIRARTYTTGGTQNSTIDLPNQIATAFDVTGVYQGNADIGSSRWFIASETNNIWAFNSSGVHAGTHDFTRAFGSKPRGLHWDGTRFHTLDTNSHIWDYATAGITDATWYGSYSWYDADVSSGSVVHETTKAPFQSFVLPARSRLVIDGQPAPDAGDTDATHRDKANLLRIWVGSASGTLRLQPGGGTDSSLPLNTTSLSLDPIDVAATTTTAASFSGVTATPGSFESAAVDGSAVPITQWKGDGTGRAAYALQAQIVASGTMVANTYKDVTVTFPVPFPTGYVPVPVATPIGVDDADVKLKGSSTTNTGTVLRARRVTGTASFNIGVIVVPPT